MLITFFLQGLKMLGLIHYLTFSFLIIDSLMILYNAVVKSKFECTSVTWNSITLTNSSKLQRIQRKSAAKFFIGEGKVKGKVVPLLN
jgi:hypothetical protein